MTLLTRLGDLEKLEMKLAALYRSLAERFMEDREAAELFWKLSFEEESHAQAIRFQKRLVMTDPMNFRDVEIDTASINEIDARVDQMLLSRDISLESALNFAQETEIGAAEYQFKQAVRTSNAKLGDLLKSLGGGEQEHVQALNDFIRKRFFNLPARGKRPSVT